MSGPDTLALRAIAVACPADEAGVSLACLAMRLHVRAGRVRRGLVTLIELGAVRICDEHSAAPRYACVPGIEVPAGDVAEIVSGAPKKDDGSSDEPNPVKPYRPLRLAKRDGRETGPALAALQARDAEFEEAANILVGHTLKLCAKDAGRDVAKLAALLFDQAEAFKRASAKLQRAAVIAVGRGASSPPSGAPRHLPRVKEEGRIP